MYQPGDVLLLPFPFSDRNATKKRPVLQLAPADAMGDIICLAITSSSRHTDGFRLTGDQFSEGELPCDSWVRTGKVYTLNQSLIFGQFGTLRVDAFKQVHRAFCRQLTCID